MRLIRSWWKDRRARYGTLIALLAAIPLLPTHSIGEMAVAAVRNAAGMLDSRSPGERDGGILVQTKPARHRAVPVARTPSSRVLSETRTRPGGIGGVPGTPDVPFGGFVPGGPGSSFAPDALGGGEPLLHFGDLPTGGGGLLLFDNPPNTDTDTPGNPTPAVPEPGTYALLILGIGVIGAALRRRMRGGRTAPTTGREAVTDGTTPSLDA